MEKFIKVINLLLFFLIAANVWGDGRYLRDNVNFLDELNNGTAVLENDLTLYQVVNLNREGLRILRNAIYAKYGYIFKSPDLTSYFKKFSWYKAEFPNVDNKLNKLDIINIQLIQSVENNYPAANNDFIGFWWDPPYNRRFAVSDAGPNQLRLYPNGVYVIVWTSRLTPDGKYTFSCGLWNLSNNLLRFDGDLINVSKREGLQNRTDGILLPIDVIEFNDLLWWKYENNPARLM